MMKTCNLDTTCLMIFVLFQHLYSIHLADQNEDCTMQLADHIRVSIDITCSLRGICRKFINHIGPQSSFVSIFFHVFLLRCFCFCCLKKIDFTGYSWLMFMCSLPRVPWTAWLWRWVVCGHSCTRVRKKPTSPCC